MLWEERGAFAQHPDDIGCVPDLQLHLNTEDEIPVQRCYNAIPKQKYNDVKEQINNMLKRGWITKSNSPWASPIVMARKKDGNMRLCVDYRLLNKKTIPDKHPIPRITESLDRLQGAEILCSLDLSRAYHQGFMSPESSTKTSFVTPWGIYKWVRIPFGLSNAVPTFQRFMNQLLDEYHGDFVIAYLDDTLVYSKTIPEHIEQIRKVLRKFQSVGLKLNPVKCDLFKREVTYLGRIVSKLGYRMDPRSIQAVKELANKQYETVGDLRKLMGLLNYHRRHVQGFSELARPLNKLLSEEYRDESAKKIQKGRAANNGLPSNQKINWTG